MCVSVCAEGERKPMTIATTTTTAIRGAATTLMRRTTATLAAAAAIVISMGKELSSGSRSWREGERGEEREEEEGVAMG